MDIYILLMIYDSIYVYIQDIMYPILLSIDNFNTPVHIYN